MILKTRKSIKIPENYRPISLRHYCKQEEQIHLVGETTVSMGETQTKKIKSHGTIQYNRFKTHMEKACGIPKKQNS